MWVVIIWSVLLGLLIANLLSAFWFYKNRPPFSFTENERASSLAIKIMALPEIAHIHPDSEYGTTVVKRLNELVVISQEKREKLVGLLHARDKKQREAFKELEGLTREMITIMNKLYDDTYGWMERDRKIFAKLRK